MKKLRSLAAAALVAAAVLPPLATAQTATATAAERAAAPAVPGAAGRDPARPFFEQHLPAPLRREGPRGLLWWQWVAFPVLVAGALALGALLGLLTRRALGHLAARTATTWDDLLLERIASPLTALWAIALVTLGHPWLLLGDAAASVLHHLLRAATYLAVFWGALRSLEVAFGVLAEAPWTRTNPSLAALLPLGRKLGKVVLLALGLVAVLNELGFQVASLLAGLGIGGIAIALAAQKTVEHLFGSVAIGVDQPFRVGDFVKIEEFVGHVESIGMRSTQIRTLERTIITLPNGKLADMRTETFAPRDRIRLVANLGLTYGTTASQMREVIREVEAALKGHPRIFPEGIGVRFNDFKDSALNVEVTAWFATADFNEFCAIRTELFLRFMEIVERAGTSFAFPTRTVHLVSETAAAGAPGAPPAAQRPT